MADLGIAALRAYLPFLPAKLGGYVLDGLIGEVVRAPRDGEPDDGDPRGYPQVMSWCEEDEGCRPEPEVLAAILAAANAFPALLAEVDRLTGALKDARDGMASAESGWEDDPHGACYRVRLNVEAALKPGDPIIQKAIVRANAAAIALREGSDASL